MRIEFQQKRYVDHNKILIGLSACVLLTATITNEAVQTAVQVATFNPNNHEAAKAFTSPDGIGVKTIADVNKAFASVTSPGNMAIATAEGNRKITGEKTKLYAGHIDPSMLGGRAVKNKGFCSSYGGHKGGGVEQADNYCLNRIKKRIPLLHVKFQRAGVNPKEHFFAFWNAVDLWNQAGDPEDVRFPALYAQNIKNGMESGAAILKARVDSFRWQAGGLYNICRREPFYINKLRGLQGNAWKYKCTELDQRRRMTAASKTLQHIRGK